MIITPAPSLYKGTRVTVDELNIEHNPCSVLADSSVSSPKLPQQCIVLNIHRQKRMALTTCAGSEWLCDEAYGTDNVLDPSGSAMKRMALTTCAGSEWLCDEAYGTDNMCWIRVALR